MGGEGFRLPPTPARTGGGGGGLIQQRPLFHEQTRDRLKTRTTSTNKSGATWELKVKTFFLCRETKNKTGNKKAFPNNLVNYSTFRDCSKSGSGVCSQRDTTILHRET